MVRVDRFPQTWDKSGSEQRGFVDEVAFGEAGKTELVRVGDAGVAVQDHVGNYFSSSRRMHHPVPAEAVGEKESRNFGNRAKDGVMVWRHFVKPCPCALGIYGKILEARHPVGSAGQDSFDERGVKISVVSEGVLFRI